MKNRVYILSGYFAEVFVTNDLHNGHKKYIEDVLNRLNKGDKVIAIVNNRNQRYEKYKNVFISPAMIKEDSDNNITERLSEIYPEVLFVTSRSKDRTVIADLQKFSDFFTTEEVVFVKDTPEYNIRNLPEASVKNITFLFLQNPKENSASKIISNK